MSVQVILLRPVSDGLVKSEAQRKGSSSCWHVKCIWCMMTDLHSMGHGWPLLLLLYGRFLGRMYSLLETWGLAWRSLLKFLSWALGLVPSVCLQATDGHILWSEGSFECQHLWCWMMAHLEVLSRPMDPFKGFTDCRVDSSWGEVHRDYPSRQGMGRWFDMFELVMQPRIACSLWQYSWSLPP